MKLESISMDLKHLTVSHSGCWILLHVCGKGNGAQINRMLSQRCQRKEKKTVFLTATSTGPAVGAKRWMTEQKEYCPLQVKKTTHSFFGKNSLHWLKTRKTVHCMPNLSSGLRGGELSLWDLIQKMHFKTSTFYFWNNYKITWPNSAYFRNVRLQPLI